MIDSNLLNLKGVSNKRLEALEKAGFSSFEDILLFFPRNYVDRGQVRLISTLQGSGEAATVIASIYKVSQAGFGRKTRLEAFVRDSSGIMKLVWFKGANYIGRTLKPGSTVMLFGTVKRFGGALSMAHPEMEVISEVGGKSAVPGIVPAYSQNQHLKKAFISGKLLQSWAGQILEEYPPPEFLPEPVLREMGYPRRLDAFMALHFPKTAQPQQSAIDRFKFEELFMFQLGLARLRHINHKRNPGLVFHKGGSDSLTSRFFDEVLPFELTEGQKSANGDIERDLASGLQMNRLVQGDVGAGKTVVAIGAMLLAIDNGYQTAFMAPTEILAEQHYQTLANFLEPLGIEIRLLVGGQKAAKRREILASIADGYCQITVGTHAVIQDKVVFNRLGLAVIDEQHRFGVSQRADLQQKGNSPHILVMSATPIPRSLAMTAYGELDVSIIKGLPKGRKPIRTAVRTESKRSGVYDFVDTVLAEGGQAYIVYPLVEESEALDLKDATEGFEAIKQRFPEVSIGLLHGRMKGAEKDEIMSAFSRNETQILVSTTVIEVGVDVPNASVMIIEHAERFGLSQLHQLRGRVGRGSRQSYCILMTDGALSEDGRIRLRTMEDTTDGFEIAEVDLKLRGPGDVLGTKQSGLPEFRLADIVEDGLLLQKAKDLAEALIRQDPNLELPENKELKKVFEPYYKSKERFYLMA